jgi:aspartate/methionine/tyrosine aminotransferase
VFSQLLGLQPIVLPSLEELGPALARPESRIRACVFCSPSNPSGTVASAVACWAALDLCARYGVWAISDEAYEHFVFDG